MEKKTLELLEKVRRVNNLRDIDMTLVYLRMGIV